MDCWASLDHKLRYKLPEDIPEEIKEDMNLRAIDIREYDKTVQHLYDLIREFKEKK